MKTLVSFDEERILLSIPPYKEAVDKTINLLTKKFQKVSSFANEPNYQKVFKSGINLLKKNFKEFISDTQNFRNIALYLPKLLEVKVDNDKKIVHYTIQLLLNSDIPKSAIKTLPEHHQRLYDSIKDNDNLHELSIINVKELGLFEPSFIGQQIEHLYPNFKQIIEHDIFAQVLAIEHVVQLIVFAIVNGNFRVYNQIVRGVIEPYSLKYYYTDKFNSLAVSMKEQFAFEIANWIISNIDTDIIEQILKTYKFTEVDIQKAIQFFKRHKYANYFNLISFAFTDITKTNLYTTEDWQTITKFILKEFTKSPLFMPVWNTVYLHFLSDVEPLMEPLLEHEKHIIGLYNWKLNLQEVLDVKNIDELKLYKVYIHFKSDWNIPELKDYVSRLLIHLMVSVNDFENFTKQLSKPITLFTIEDLYLLNNLPYLLPPYSLYIIATEGLTFVIPYSLVNLFVDFTFSYSEALTMFFSNTYRFTTFVKRRNFDRLSVKINKTFQELVNFYLVNLTKDTTETN